MILVGFPRPGGEAEDAVFRFCRYFLTAAIDAPCSSGAGQGRRAVSPFLAENGDRPKSAPLAAGAHQERSIGAEASPRREVNRISFFPHLWYGREQPYHTLLQSKKQLLKGSHFPVSQGKSLVPAGNRLSKVKITAFRREFTVFPSWQCAGCGGAACTAAPCGKFIKREGVSCWQPSRRLAGSASRQ